MKSVRLALALSEVRLGPAGKLASVPPVIIQYAAHTVEGCPRTVCILEGGLASRCGYDACMQWLLGGGSF